MMMHGPRIILDSLQTIDIKWMQKDTEIAKKLKIYDVYFIFKDTKIDFNYYDISGLICDLRCKYNFDNMFFLEIFDNKIALHTEAKLEDLHNFVLHCISNTSNDEMYDKKKKYLLNKISEEIKENDRDDSVLRLNDKYGNTYIAYKI